MQTVRIQERRVVGRPVLRVQLRSVVVGDRGGKTHLGLLSDLPNLGPGLPQRVKEPPQRGPGTQPGVVGIELAIVRRTVQGEQFPS